VTVWTKTISQLNNISQKLQSTFNQEVSPNNAVTVWTQTISQLNNISLKLQSTLSQEVAPLFSSTELQELYTILTILGKMFKSVKKELGSSSSTELNKLENLLKTMITNVQSGYNQFAAAFASSSSDEDSGDEDSGDEDKLRFVRNPNEN
jgi:hypothetical protein